MVKRSPSSMAGLAGCHGMHGRLLNTTHLFGAFDQFVALTGYCTILRQAVRSPRHLETTKRTVDRPSYNRVVWFCTQAVSWD